MVDTKMTGKRKKGSKQHRTRQHCSVHRAADVLEVSDDNTATRSDGEGSSERVFSTEEFADPFELGDIVDEVRQRMVVAAPMLMGREAEYGKEFFINVVGLSDQGPLLRDVSKCYSFISDDEVTSVWKEGSKGRYDFSRCEDAEQLKQFGKQYFKVYGNRPHNNYFCLRFLKACFATFVYGKPVNWCAEALDRHEARLKNAWRNPTKLGPVATRCQIEGLITIVKDLCGTGWGRVEPDLPIRELQAALDVEQQKSDTVKEVEDRLQQLRQRYNSSLERISAESSEIAEEDLNSKYVSKLKEARLILRTEGASRLYQKTIQESEALSKELADMREADAQIRENVVQLELLMGNEARALEVANEELQISRAAVSASRGQVLTIKTPRVFQYPEHQSIPPLGYPGKEGCAYCGLGFIWKAAILSSCGCFVHPPCAAEMVSCQNYRCKICKDLLLASSPIHLAEPWVAQFGGALNSQQEIECTSFAAVLKAASDSISVPTGSGTKN